MNGNHELTIGNIVGSLEELGIEMIGQLLLDGMQGVMVGGVRIEKIMI